MDTEGVKDVFASSNNKRGYADHEIHLQPYARAREQVLSGWPRASIKDQRKTLQKFQHRVGKRRMQACSERTVRCVEAYCTSGALVAPPLRGTVAQHVDVPLGSTPVAKWRLRRGSPKV